MHERGESTNTIRRDTYSKHMLVISVAPRCGSPGTHVRCEDFKQNRPPGRTRDTPCPTSSRVRARPAYADPTPRASPLMSPGSAANCPHIRRLVYCVVVRRLHFEDWAPHCGTPERHLGPGRAMYQKTKWAQFTEHWATGSEASLAAIPWPVALPSPG